MPYYAVAKGRSSGIYGSWGDCEQQVKGYSGASFKKFDSIDAARNFVSSGGGSGSSGAGGGSSSASGGGICSSGYSSGWSGPSKQNSNFKADRDGYVQVYTDGACLNNGRSGARAGLGVYWDEGHHLNTSEPVSGRATNNSGEIQAANRAMKTAIQNGVTKLAINTDSQFLIDSATKWMPDWKQQGWKLASGDPVKNEKDFKELDKLSQKLDVKWNYVEAHKGVRGNEMADKLAKEGASKYQ